MIKLSIVIPVYNVQEHIEKCIVSVAEQNISNSEYEIILINDGSTDNSLEVINKVSKKYSNIKIYDQNNTGLGGARNKGIELSNGEYIWFIDSDDYIERNILLEITTNLYAKKLDVLAMNFNVVNSDGGILNLGEYINPNKNDVISGAEFYLTNYVKSYSCMFVFSRGLFVNNNIRFKERINMQDSEIFPKLMYFTKHLALFEKVTYNYVQHTNSFTNSSNPEVRFKYFKSIIAVQNSLAAFSNQIEENHLLIKGIQLKQNGINKTIFDHLIYFNYDKDWLKKIINFLKENNSYPIKYKAQGKLRFIKFAINTSPVITKSVIDTIRKYK